MIYSFLPLFPLFPPVFPESDGPMLVRGVNLYLCHNMQVRLLNKLFSLPFLPAPFIPPCSRIPGCYPEFPGSCWCCECEQTRRAAGFNWSFWDKPVTAVRGWLLEWNFPFGRGSPAAGQLLGWRWPYPQGRALLSLLHCQQCLTRVQVFPGI